MSQSVVLDANVLVSAALKPDSDLARIVEQVLLKQTPLHLCPTVLAEYQDVLHRSKFRRKGLPPVWLPRLVQVAFHEPEPAPWPLPGPDRDDLVFLALAKASGAVLVTGNLAHFPLPIRAGVRVVGPAAYLAG